MRAPSRIDLAQEETSREEFMKPVKKLACLSLLGAVSLGALASGALAADKFVVGVSNTLIGNGWREEMICSIKAQAEASGVVSKVIVANRNGGPAEQIADLRNLISAGVNAIILNPSDREALNPVIKQAGGKGSVVEMRGIDGVPADADRHQGFTEALKDFPDIKVTSSVFTGWALNKTAQATKDLLASGKPIDGIWTSGIDSTVVDAYKTAGKPYVPVVGADNNGFVGQLIDLKGSGFTGAAVTNPPSVGGAGLAGALDVLQKKDHPHVIKINPAVWDNTSDAHIAALKKNYDPKLDPFYGVAYEVKPYTSYSMAQILACKGP